MGVISEDARSRLEVRRSALVAFAEENELRLDWHEPDEQGVSARVSRGNLDNAFGEQDKSGEKVVTLFGNNGTSVKINLANLLALATYLAREHIRATER